MAFPLSTITLRGTSILCFPYRSTVFAEISTNHGRPNCASQAEMMGSRYSTMCWTQCFCLQTSLQDYLALSRESGNGSLWKTSYHPQWKSLRTIFSHSLLTTIQRLAHRHRPLLILPTRLPLWHTALTKRVVTCSTKFAGRLLGA